MSDDGQPVKKRRVTKACDQCRRKRIKCEAVPGAEVDAPCLVCTENGAANGCTFSRPSRKRGPTAGQAKNLAERVNGLERLLGHLLIVHPPILDLTSTFFHPSHAPPTTPATQALAFQTSLLPQLLESLPPVTNSPDAEVKPNPRAVSSAPSVDERMAATDSGWSPVASGSGQSPIAGSLTFAQREVLGLPSHLVPVLAPHAGLLGQPSQNQQYVQYASGGPELHSNGLQTLASVAVPDDDSRHFASVEAEGKGRQWDWMEGVMSESSLAAESSSPRIPSLPTESIRNQLMDLYFNQMVHPSYPMLDKSAFFRWSAHLPSQNAATSSVARALPPELFLAVFAITAPYLPPGSSVAAHSSETFAAASRAHLYTSLGKPTLETVQACSLLALVDWAQGELNRAYTLSSIAIALSLTISLHININLDASLRVETDPNASKLKTFHSALIIHTLLSLRVLRPPIIILEDYDIPPPPFDGPENFELWRSDKSPEELRAEHESELHPQVPRNASGPRLHAVRSCALSTFSQMASLCAIGISVIRWGVCARQGHGRGIATGEEDRERLVGMLLAWERELPTELRLSDHSRGVERIAEKSRHTIEMHLLLYTFYQRLSPHHTYKNVALDPAPDAVALTSQILTTYLDNFTFYRSLPTIELVLHTYSTSLFSRNEYIHQDHEGALSAYAQLAQILPVVKTSLQVLRRKVGEKKKDADGKSYLAAAALPPLPPVLTGRNGSTLPAEPFQSFLDSSSTLLDSPLAFDSANPSSVLDFGQWDQSDLLVSLGLVVDPANSHPWQPPPIEHENDHGLQGEMMLGMQTPPGAFGYPSDPQQSTDLLTRWLDRGMLAFGEGDGGD